FATPMIRPFLPSSRPIVISLRLMIMFWIGRYHTTEATKRKTRPTQLRYRRKDYATNRLSAQSAPGQTRRVQGASPGRLARHARSLTAQWLAQLLALPA